MGSDALERRPQLREALAEARKAKASMIVAKLARLSRGRTLHLGLDVSTRAVHRRRGYGQGLRHDAPAGGRVCRQSDGADPAAAAIWHQDGACACCRAECARRAHDTRCRVAYNHGAQSTHAPSVTGLLHASATPSQPAGDPWGGPTLGVCRELGLARAVGTHCELGSAAPPRARRGSTAVANNSRKPECHHQHHAQSGSRPSLPPRPVHRPTGTGPRGHEKAGAQLRICVHCELTITTAHHARARV